MWTPRSPELLRHGVAVALWCLVVVALPANAADARGQAIEQQRLLNLKFDEQDRRCRQQFVVTACVDDVRRQRRDAVAPWREKELAAEDEVRQQRAAQRQRDIASKQAAAAAAAPVNAAVSPSASSSGNAAANAASGASAPARAQPRTPTPTQALPARQGAATPDSKALASREALRRVQAAAKRQQQADVDAARINKLKAEQAARGKAAAPLPVPGAASAN